MEYKNKDKDIQLKKEIILNDKIYNKILVPLFGHCGEVIPLKKSTKNKSYSENIYVWIKNG